MRSKKHWKKRYLTGLLLVAGVSVLVPLEQSGLVGLGGVEVQAGGDDKDDGSDRQDTYGRHDRHRPDYFLASRPENLVWGGLPINYPPALTIDSGQTVHVDTVSPDGATNATLDPVAFFGLFGVKPHEVLRDARDFWASRDSKIRYGTHPLTGPIYITGAEPGDALEVQILDVTPRVPYGINSTSAFRGVLSMTYPGFRAGDPGLNIPSAPPDAPGGIFPGQLQHLYRIARVKGQDVAVLSDTVQVPIAPFMGVNGGRPCRGRVRRVNPHVAATSDGGPEFRAAGTLRRQLRS